jgi:hypothetical protein
MKAKEITDKISALKLTKEVIESWSEDFPFSTDTPYGLTEILDADTPQKINEASLGRVYQHFQKSKETSWAILTSWRDIPNDVDNEKNYINLKSLKTVLKKWGYFPLIGHGQEEDEEGNVRVVQEPSYFVIGIPLINALDIAKRFNQYGIIYSGPETSGDVCLFRQDGSVEERWKDYHPGKIAKFYSSIRGRPFFFESVPSGWFEGLGAHHHGFIEVPGVNRQTWKRK